MSDASIGFPRASARVRAAAILLPAILIGQALWQFTPVASASAVPAPPPTVPTAAAAAAAAVTVAPGASSSVAINVAVPAKPLAADVLIAIDTTGSMGPSIAQAKADATSIVDGVKASVADSQFAIVDFKDSTDGVSEYRVRQSMTAVATNVASAINAMTASGGGDFPESHNLVFRNSYTPGVGGTIGWRTGTKKIVIVISDAQPHGGGKTGQNLTGCTDTSTDPHGFNPSAELNGMAAADRTLFMILQTSSASTSLQCYQSMVARTPGGVAANGGTALGSQIVTLINNSFTGAIADLHLNTISATPAPAATSWIGLTPLTLAAVPTPSTQTFTANVTVPAGTAEGAYTFDVASIADGADIGHTTLTVNVSSPIASVPILSQAVPQGLDTLVSGVAHGSPSTTYHLRFVTAATCPGGVMDPAAVTFATKDAITNAAGDAYFGGAVTNTAALSTYVAAQIVPPGASSAIGPCIVASPDNDQWPRALDITSTAASTGYLDAPGRARWYKLAIQPGSRLTITLTNVPGDYDLFVFKDIEQAYTSLTDTASLTKLSAEFAPSAFSPSAFSPSAFSPSAFSPSAFSPSAFSPSAFSPSAFSPSAFSPSAFSPSAFSPSAFSPSAFSPSAFSPSAFSPSAFSPSAFSPSGFSPSAFSGAQTRSLIGVSASVGLVNETVVADTWNNTGYFYLRVSGKNGESSLASPFSVAATSTGNFCSTVAPIGSPPTPADLGLSSGGTLKTLMLEDSSRMAGTATEIATLQTKLDTLKARSEVAGATVDLKLNPRIQALQAQADAHIPCMYAKNLVATAIKDIITAYRSVNPNLQYIVLVGEDRAIPFFRYPDQSLFGEERDYDAPVGPSTASKASLASNFVLGQDAYGATTELSLRASTFPVPDLAVGRLVETAAEASGVIDAYLGTAAGVVATPATSLVTGYDFLEDAANSVKSDLDLGIGSSGDSLITRSTVAPGKLCDPLATTPVALPNCSWNAEDLKSALLGSRHDLIYLAGHFSANNALAADYLTTVNAADLANAPAALDLRNSIIFSAGCHSGYNVVNADATSAEGSLDWAQAAAQRGATLLAGTGYQYGDTDFLEYSERIYAEFAHQLRVGTGAVSIGQAFMRAKQIYLASTPDIRGLHEKALLESAIFGLPMLSVNMPTGRVPAPTTTSIVSSSSGFTANPGLTLGLRSADVALNSIPTDVRTVTLAQLNLADPPASVGTVTATYYRGRDGVVTNPGEPALPLQSENVSVSGKVLRGVGFRSGTFADSTIVPLTGAAATEIRGIHNAFSSTAFYPMRPWSANYYDALAGGATRLLVTPAQHKVTSVGDQTATLRLYSAMGLRLFYSDYRGEAAQAAAPSITGVRATVNGSIVTVQARVTGDPAAGIQQVWMTHNGTPNQWQSVDLTQDVLDSTLWTGTLTLPSGGTTSNGLRLMVQAVNGVGLVAMDDNLGTYYTVTLDSTRPTISAAISGGTIGSNGWYTSSVTVHFTCLDGTGFGIPTGACPAPQTLSAEGPSISSSAVTVTNAAGNTSDPSNVITVKVDKTAPIIGAVVASGTVGSNAWYTSDVTIHYTCADTGGSGIPAGACPANQLLTSEAPAVSSTAQMVSDLAGNTSAASNVVTVKIDKTSPTIVAAVSGGTFGANGWYTSNVTVHATCDDGVGSGIPATGCPADQILSAEGSSVSSSAVNATDAAGNTSAASNVITVKIDKTGPTLSPSVTPNPIVINGSATATSGAADATSGIASQSCGPVNTSTVGTNYVSCTATDAAGNTSNASVPYRVNWPFTGFFSPVDNLPILNIANAGSTIPVKFSLGGNRGLGIFLNNAAPTAAPINCPSNPTTDTIEVTTTLTSSLTYDAATNTYQYNWKTAKTYATKCYRLDVKLADGSTYSANFQFK